MEQGGSSLIGSLRSSTRIWRGSEAIFTRSSRDEDDEDALKWASLEKLPTYERMKKGILRGEEGTLTEVNVQDMSGHERNMLLGRLIRDAEQDNAEFLQKLKDRLDR